MAESDATTGDTEQPPMQTLQRFSAVNRYGLAFALLLASYVQALYVADDLVGSSSLVLVQLLTVYLVLSVSESDRIRRVAGIAFLCAAGLTIVTMLLGPQTDSSNILFGLFLVNIVLYGVAPVVIIKHIFFRQVVDRQTFLGALCAYIMIGMFFAFTFGAVQIILGQPFFTDESANAIPDYLFFSFVTITTTGYGDLVPADEVGQTLAVWEAILGQFFLAAVVAKIVSAWRPSFKSRTSADDA